MEHMANQVDNSDFKHQEQIYWNRRFEQETDLLDLERIYKSMIYFEDNWGISHYMNHILANYPPRTRVLEVGAGLVSQAVPLALFHGYPIVITDISMASLLANRKVVQKMNPRASVGYSVADADNLPFNNGAFDVVLTHATLHHLPDPKHTVKEMIRCLRSNGLLILGHEPNRRVFGPLRKLASGIHITERYTRRFVDGMYSVADEETPGFFGGELRRWMNEYGMEIVWMKPIWFTSAILYNVPALTSIILRKSVSVPDALRRWSLRFDSRILSQVPLLRECGLFWSLGASKR